MTVIEAARIAVLKQARAMLGWHPPRIAGPALLGSDGDTAEDAPALVMTPAQDVAFFARSSAWRCTGCGKVHNFDERVSVVFASPCACTSIEFEPQRGDAFAAAAAVASPTGLALSGLAAT